MSSITQRNTGFKMLPQEDPIDIEFKPRNQQDPRLDTLISILHSLVWLFLAILTWYYADIYTVMFTPDPRLNFMPLYLFITSAITVIGAMGYVLTHHYISRNTNLNYLEVYPVAIHIATFASLSAFIFITIAIWPVWGIKSFILSFINLMAFLLTPNIIPSCGF